MKLNRIVPLRVRINPLKFYDDIISDVISGDIALWACEHDNLTIFHPISTKIGMVDGIWVQTNPIEKRLFINFVFQQLHCRGVAPPSAALVNTYRSYRILFISYSALFCLNTRYLFRHCDILLHVVTPKIVHTILVEFIYYNFCFWYYYI